VICAEQRATGQPCDRAVTVAVVVDGVARMLCDSDALRVGRQHVLAGHQVELRELRGQRARLWLSGAPSEVREALSS
jgi:hypothetical protein